MPRPANPEVLHYSGFTASAPMAGWTASFLRGDLLHRLISGRADGSLYLNGAAIKVESETRLMGLAIAVLVTFAVQLWPEHLAHNAHIPTIAMLLRTCPAHVSELAISAIVTSGVRHLTGRLGSVDPASGRGAPYPASDKTV